MPLIIAHRGASKDAPENTFAAFKRAIDAGADGIELDVRLAKDGVAVVFHDSSLKRTAGRKGKISHFTSTELGSIDAGSWFNRNAPKLADPLYKNESVRTLAETLSFLKDFGGLIYIELKCKEADAKALAKSVCKVICDSPLLSQIVVKSFKLSALPHVKKFCPAVRTAALFAPKVKNILRKDKHLLRLATDAGADEISLHYTLATRKLMKKAAKRTCESSSGPPITLAGSAGHSSLGWTPSLPTIPFECWKGGGNSILKQIRQNLDFARIKVVTRRYRSFDSYLSPRNHKPTARDL